MTQKKTEHNEEQESLQAHTQSDQSVAQDDSALDPVEQMEKDLAEAKQKIVELTEAYMRAAADLQNFRRRAEDDKKNLMAFANANLILEILPIVDNFERAFAHKPADIAKEWNDGIEQIYKNFKQILEKQGVTEIKAQGEKYDHNLHEAMLHSAGEDGIIVQVLEKGYLLNGKVLRPTKVSVGNGG